MSQDQKIIPDDKALNKDAKEYVPTKHRSQKEEGSKKPKVIVQYVEEDEDEEALRDIREKIDKLENDMIEAEAMNELVDDISDDEDKWFPLYRDCECCKGFVFNCKGEACADLGQCYCKMKDECDKKLDENK